MVFNLIARSAMDLTGAQTCAVVDLESGTCLGRCTNDESFNVSHACNINAQLMRAKVRLVREQSPNEAIEDVMITLHQHYHLIRLLETKGGTPMLFLYLIVDRTTANLVMARRKLADIEQALWRIPNIEQHISDSSLAAMLRTPVSSRSLDFGTSSGYDTEENDDELPPFMRDEVVLKLLGISSEANRSEMCLT